MLAVCFCKPSIFLFSFGVGGAFEISTLPIMSYMNDLFLPLQYVFIFLILLDRTQPLAQCETEVGEKIYSYHVACGRKTFNLLPLIMKLVVGYFVDSLN